MHLAPGCAMLGGMDRIPPSEGYPRTQLKFEDLFESDSATRTCPALAGWL